MRNILTALLVSGLVVAPAQASGWNDQPLDTRAGAFVGARFKIPLGGATASRPGAALAIAPTVSRISSDGMIHTRVGEGVAFNLAPSGKPSLTLAGVRADAALGLQRRDRINAKNKLGISTGGWIAIGLGTAAVAGALIFYAMLTHCPDEADECG